MGWKLWWNLWESCCAADASHELHSILIAIRLCRTQRVARAHTISRAIAFSKPAEMAKSPAQGDVGDVSRPGKQIAMRPGQTPIAPEPKRCGASVCPKRQLQAARTDPRGSGDGSNRQRLVQICVNEFFCQSHVPWARGAATTTQKCCIIMLVRGKQSGNQCVFHRTAQHARANRVGSAIRL